MDPSVEWSPAVFRMNPDSEPTLGDELPVLGSGSCLDSLDQLPLCHMPDPYGSGQQRALQIPRQEAEGGCQREQSVQTDPQTVETAINTEPCWEAEMHAVEERSMQLALQYELLLKKQETEQLQHDGRIKQLEQQRDDRKHQHQALIDKMESLRVKLKLNCCKTTRKNFNNRKQELTKEKEQLEEERNRLKRDLEEAEKRLTALIEEQCQEKLSWERELTELQREAERLRTDAEESSQAALRDEILALETQREVSISLVEDWIAEAERYLNTLRCIPAALSAEVGVGKTVAIMRSHLGTLQRQFDAQMQQLQRGQPFSSLPPVTLPTLPTVPTLDLLLGSMAMPPSGAMPIQIAPQQPTVSMAMPFIQHRPASATPPVRVTPQTVDRIQQQTLSPAPLPNPAPVPKLNPAPPVPSHTPGPTQPAGKLDQLLDKLGARFPQCTRAQLISVLQQIKMARSGTMAGLSIEELTQQVTQRLAQMDRPSLGPIGPPSAARGFPGSAAQVQRTPPPSQAPAVAQVFQTRPPQSVGSSTLKMCLMCQNPVELGSQHDVSCSHVIHKECISVWLQTSKNNSCPFCPSK